MKKKTWAFILAIGCVAVAAIVILCVFSRNPFPSENIRGGKEAPASFPVSSAEMNAFLSLQYYETADIAGFADYADSFDDISHYRFAYYGLSLMEELGITGSESECAAYLEHFINYHPDFDTMNLQDVGMFATISRILKSDYYVESILADLEKRFIPETGMYAEDRISDKPPVGTWEATNKVLSIYDELGVPCGHYSEVRDALKDYLASHEIIADDSKLALISLTNMLDCFSDLNSAEIFAWAEDETANICMGGDYSATSILHASDLSEVYQSLGHCSELLSQYFSYYSFPEGMNYYYDEYEWFAGLQYARGCRNCGIIAEIPDGLEDYLHISLQTAFIRSIFIQPTPMNTFYGVVLSDTFGFEYDENKVETAVRSYFLPSMLSSETARDEDYVLNLYFYTLLLKRMNLSCDIGVQSSFSNGLATVLDNLDLTADDRIYSNLYTIQFMLEISELQGFEVAGLRSAARAYLELCLERTDISEQIYLVEMDLIAGLLSDPVLRGRIAKMEKEMKKKHFVEGGFCSSLEYPVPDVITTGKLCRTETDLDKDKLRTFLTSLVEGKGRIHALPDLSDYPDLRGVYNFYRLWVEKGL